MTKIPFFTRGVPHLAFDDLVINDDATDGMFNPDVGFGFEVEFVLGES